MQDAHQMSEITSCTNWKVSIESDQPVFSIMWTQRGKYKLILNIHGNIIDTDLRKKNQYRIMDESITTAYFSQIVIIDTYDHFLLLKKRYTLKAR